MRWAAILEGWVFLSSERSWSCEVISAVLRRFCCVSSSSQAFLFGPPPSPWSPSSWVRSQECEDRSLELWTRISASFCCRSCPICMQASWRNISRFVTKLTYHIKKKGYWSQETSEYINHSLYWSFCNVQCHRSYMFLIFLTWTFLVVTPKYVLLASECMEL